MAHLYSLDGSGFRVELPDDDRLKAARRVMVIETLEGAVMRDLGAVVEGLELDIAAVVDGDAALEIFRAARSGAAMGLSLSIVSWSVVISSFETSRRPDGMRDARLKVVVTGEI